MVNDVRKIPGYSEYILVDNCIYSLKTGNKQIPKPTRYDYEVLYLRKDNGVITKIKNEHINKFIDALKNTEYIKQNYNIEADKKILEANNIPFTVIDNLYNNLLINNKYYWTKNGRWRLKGVKKWYFSNGINDFLLRFYKED